MRMFCPASLSACVALSCLLVSAPAVTVPPGGSASLVFAPPAPGLLLASNPQRFTDDSSDGIIETLFTSEVYRTPAGTLTFRYHLSSFLPNVGINPPVSLFFTGFVGTAIDVARIGDLPGAPAGSIHRSEDGDGFRIFPSRPILPSLTFDVATDATAFSQRGTAAFTYESVSNLPFPPDEPTIVTYRFDTFAPLTASNPAIPEPLTLATLPLALAALSLKKRLR